LQFLPTDAHLTKFLYQWNHSYISPSLLSYHHHSCIAQSQNFYWCSLSNYTNWPILLCYRMADKVLLTSLPNTSPSPWLIFSIYSDTDTNLKNLPPHTVLIFYSLIVHDLPIRSLHPIMDYIWVCIHYCLNNMWVVNVLWCQQSVVVVKWNECNTTYLIHNDPSMNFYAYYKLLILGFELLASLKPP
jgi:hypothetical protein